MRRRIQQCNTESKLLENGINLIQQFEKEISSEHCLNCTHYVKDIGETYRRHLLHPFIIPLEDS